MLGACTRPPQLPEEEPVTLTVGYSLEPAGLDPSTISGAGTPFVLLYNVYETLVRIDDQSEIKPLLAREWTLSPDLKTYTFSLDPAAKFASGKPVNADAVVTSLERIRTDAKVVDKLKSEMAPVDTIEATDDHTVTITLKQPSHQWLFDMTGPAGIVYDPEGLTTLDSKPAGSGPYEFVSWDQGNELKLKRTADYWGTGPRVSDVTFRLFTDPNAMNTAMLSGQLDVISNLTVPDALDQFSDPNRFTVLEGVTDGEVVLGFNHTSAPLKDLKVRQAINHAIDRRALVDSVWGGKGELIGSMVATRDPWYEDLSDTYAYNPTKAKELLKQAGFEKGLTLRLRVPTLPYGPPIGRFVTAQLREVGIEVKLDELEFARWLDLVYTKGDYDMTVVAHVEPRDIGNFANPDYYWHYDNPEIGKLLAEADAGDAETQKTKIQEAARLLADDAAADWLFQLPNLIITTKDVTGIPANGTNLSFDLTSVATNH